MSVAQGVQVQADTSKPVVEIRFARSAPAAGFQEMTEPRSSRRVYVASENVFTDADFAEVRSRNAADGLVLNARWKPGASVARWVQLQRGEVGAGNEMLAVFVNGELVNTPIIVVNPNSAPTQDVIIAVPVASEKREQIRAAVARRWPPGRG